MRFTIGQKYSTWEKKGVAPDKAGRLAISENSFEQGEVLPEQELEYLGKKLDGEFKGVHAFKLPDGRIVKGHPNHFDKTTPYNQAKLARRAKDGDSGPTDSPEARAQRIENLKEMLQGLEAQQASEQEAEQESPQDLLAEAAAE